MSESYELRTFKVRLAHIFLSHFRFILDLRDFIMNTIELKMFLNLQDT